MHFLGHYDRLRFRLSLAMLLTGSSILTGSIVLYGVMMGKEKKKAVLIDYLIMPAIN